MRQIDAGEISRTVCRLLEEANHHLPDDVLAALRAAGEREASPAGREVLASILENARIAARGELPLCQDCGVAVVFVELGQEARVTGGGLYDAINTGVSRAYREGYLRRSMVRRPFSDRANTGDNTPAVIHVDIVPGDHLNLAVMPKGGGSENMTRLAMLPPAAGRPGVVDFIVRAVDQAGGNPCPPVILGIGIGGTAEMTTLLAKKALLRKVGAPNPDTEVSALEREVLERVNHLGVGPMGYGGRITALAVHIEVFPAHIASLPVAVSPQCHCARHREAVL